MYLHKYGVEIQCEQCRYLRGDDAGGFEVAVPVSLGGTGVAGVATLRCRVAAERHEVALTALRDDAGLRRLEPPPDAMEKVSAALDAVARHRICGNRNLCPRDVVRIVEARGGRE